MMILLALLFMAVGDGGGVHGFGFGGYFQQSRNSINQVFVGTSTDTKTYAASHYKKGFQLSTSNNSNNSDNSGSPLPPSSSLQLIQQYLLLHLPSLSPSDLKLYSTQLLEDGFDTVEKLESLNNNSNGSNGLGGKKGGGRRLEDLYFMKKGHRRVLLQKIGKVREMRSISSNRLHNQQDDDNENLKTNDDDDGEIFDKELVDRKADENTDETEDAVGEKLKLEKEQEDAASAIAADLIAAAATFSPSSQLPLLDDDDDSLISLTAWENKQLEDFVYNEQERYARDDKGKRRLKEIIDKYLTDDNNDNGNSQGYYDGNDGGDEKKYDMTTFETRQLEEFVYNEQERGVMSDKGKRRLKEIEAYIQEQQQRLRRERREEEDEKNFRIDRNDESNYDDEGVSSSPSLPSSWNFQDLEDFVYNEQEREVQDNKGKRRLKEIEEYVRMEQQRLREEEAKRRRSKNDDDGDYYHDAKEEELLDDFSARYQGIVTARDGKVIGGSVGSSSTAKKEQRRLGEFLDAWLARQRKGGVGSFTYQNTDVDEAMIDDFASRYQELGLATADGVSGGTSDKSTRRLKELDAFLRARQSRQSRGLREGDDTPLDDFEARYQIIGDSAADTVGDGRRDKSSRRLRALDAFLKSRQGREMAAAEEEALLKSQLKDLVVTERKERIRVEEFQRRARIAKEKEGNLADDSVINSNSAAKRKSNEERRLEALLHWTKKQNELVEMRRIAKILEEEERLKGTRNATKTVSKTKVKADDRSPPLIPPDIDVIIDDFFEKRRIYSLSTTLPPSNVGRRVQQKTPQMKSQARSDDGDRSLEESFDITRKSFAERESKSLSTTLQPRNMNAKTNSYTPITKSKSASRVSDFLPPRSISSDDEDCVGDECVDITRSSFPERESKSLSTTLPPSNENAKTNSYVPGSKSKDDEDCVGDECVDITRSSFPERESNSLSTTLPPSNENAKTNSYVPGSKSKDDEDCVGEECVDITRSSFPERESKSLSTTLPPSNENAKTNSYVPGSKRRPTDAGDKQKLRKCDDLDPEQYFDITTRLFQDRGGRSLSSGYQSVFKEEERSEMNSRASSLYAKFQSTPTMSPPSGSSTLSKREITTGSNQSDMKDTYIDITQRLWDERQTTSLSTPPPSSFKKEEKSEMNDRKRPSSKAASRDNAEEQRSFSSLAQFVKRTGTKQRSDNDGGYIDESERFSDRSTFVQSVNSVTNKKGMTSGSYRDSTRGAPAPVRDESSDYFDESQRFSERTSLSQSVNTGSAIRGTMSGSFSSTNANGEYQDITLNPFSTDRSSFVLRVNSGTSKMGTTTGSFRESKGRSEPEEKKYFALDRSTLRGGRTWKNEDVPINNEHNKYLSSDRSSILGTPYIRNAGGSSKEHNKYLTSDRSSLSGVPSIQRRGGASDVYLNTNQFSFDLKASSPVKASATNALWRTTSEKTGESSIDTPPAFKKNLDFLAGGKKTVKKSTASDEYLNRNSFSQSLSPSTITQAATVASRSNSPYLNKNDFNDSNKMRTSNASGAQFKSSHDVSPEEKKCQDYFDVTTAKLPGFDEMAGTSAVGENAKGSRSPKQQEEEEYTRVGNFQSLERASSSIKDANTITKSKPTTTGKKDDDSEFEVMSWILKNLPQLDEEDAVNYFVSFLEDGFDSIDMLNEVLPEDLYFMKEEHQSLLMQSLVSEEEDLISTETDLSAFTESIDEMKKELKETSVWVTEKKIEFEDRRIATSLAELEMDGGPAEKRESSTNEVSDNEFSDITRANFGGGPSLSMATPPLFDRETSTKNDKQPFPWQLDVRKESLKGDKEHESFEITSGFFSDRPSISTKQFQATPPVMVDLKERTPVKESASAREQRLSVGATKGGLRSQLFQATPPVKVELRKDVTDEDAALAFKREERVSGEPTKVDQISFSSQILEGMTAEEAEAARNTRLTSQNTSSDEHSLEELKITEKDENTSSPRGELYQQYIVRGFTTEQAQKLNDYYTTWTIGPSHEMKFTSVFTCPMSGEHFASGMWNGNGEVWGGHVWYKNKKQSMNAAAAKVLDCFSFRKNDSDSSLRRCDDEPYFEDETPSFSLPPNVVLPTELIQPNNT